MAVRQALTKNAYAYEEVRQRIMVGTLEPGQPLAQSQLAAELGVSLTPMREALRRLDAEGLVYIDAHKNARVATLSATEAKYLFEVRERMDPMAAALAAERRTDSDIVRLKEAAARLKPLADESDLDALTAHREFHRAIYTASHNELLINLLEGLWDKADRYRQVGLKTRKDSAADRRRVDREHASIMKAIIAGNAAEAERQMLQHVQGSLGRRAIDELAQEQR
ncbi:GntR family transcriptional regulator [Arthrobacter crystallopoietes]|uniref:GntR family transcriptional regulator n=1 Tax=Crystallibacter crystallopoietes TaxID=37928 RepID=UPI001ABE69F8|nr:GntR family transcriptional regulator [Arthrobacter crystallopoietes]QTG81606.1 GntR family transcriptional regulator [Arthrobacter crystallopoietes]